MRACLFAVLVVASACSSNTCKVEQLANCADCLVRGGVWFPDQGDKSYWGLGVASDGTLAIGMCTSVWFANLDGRAPSSVEVLDFEPPPAITGFATSPDGTVYVASQTPDPKPQQCQCVDSYLTTATSRAVTRRESTSVTVALAAGSEGLYRESRQDVAGALGPLVAYDTTGAVRWTQPVGARLLAHGPDRVFAAFPSVQAFDTTGQVLWNASVITNATIQYIAPTPGGGVVVSGTTDAAFVAMLAADGTTKWIHMFSGPPTSGPVAAPVAALDDAAAIMCGGAGNGVYRVDSTGVQQLLTPACFEIVPIGDGTFWAAFGGDNLTVGDRALEKPGMYFLHLAL